MEPTNIHSKSVLNKDTCKKTLQQKSCIHFSSIFPQCSLCIKPWQCLFFSLYFDEVAVEVNNGACFKDQQRLEIRQIRTLFKVNHCFAYVPLELVITK